MLRLAIYYESRLGRNDGNPLYVHSALKRMQAKGLLEVDHLAPNGDTKAFGKYDAHIVVDWGEDGLKGLLPYEVIYPTDAPLIYWASDTHLGYDYRMNMGKRSDICFVAQKKAVEQFKADGVKDVSWLPHAFEPRAYCDIDCEDGSRPYNLLTKKYDVAFIGHVNNEKRIEHLDRLFKEIPNFYFGQKLFNDAALKLAQSKIGFNVSMIDDLNMRCFEVPGSRTMLLTDDLPDLHELFEVGKHIVTYSSLDEMIDKAKYYISNDKERDEIAVAGYNHVMNNHTIDHRVNVMLDKIKQLISV